ncbi:MAG TPA: UpxY family transcription antiterminator [Ignavibacteriaceae bacterium]|nr:UpxY family transcription antiterminator [Ignavibacteriaceae bacterium]
MQRKDYERANTLSDVNQRWWFALYTKPRSEFKAAEQIEGAGIKYYLPTITKLKQWSDRKKKITEPLLRGYIFIFGNEKERIISLEQYSVVRCLTEAGRPAKIPEWQIENLKKMLSTNSDVLVKEGLVPGVRIRIKEGPFEGVIGTLQEIDKEKTLAVTIDLLNRSVVAYLPKESIIEIIKG